MSGGKSYAMLSGQSLTDAYTYRRHTSLGYAKTSIFIRADRTGSGVGYIVRGYFMPLDEKGPPIPHNITSGQLTTSGQTVLITSGLDLAYSDLEVGVKADSASQSGIATVLVASKRR